MEKEDREKLENSIQLRESKKEITLGGTAITESGKLTKSNFFRFLGHNLDDYDNIVLTKEEALKIHNHLQKLSTGSTAMVPMYCGGKDRCPFSNRCQPTGTLVKTARHGQVPIEDLDPNVHGLMTFRRKHSLLLGKTHGYAFRKQEKEYDGQLIKITTLVTGKTHLVTPEHISLVKWNESALYKQCVYLMKKGDNWRVGKSYLVKPNSQTNFALGPQRRMNTEKADAVWILGVYETNTEALLAEEYFSVKWGLPKALFRMTDSESKRVRKKQDGLYAWVTQERLDAHHKLLTLSYQKMTELLNSLGLSICAPMIEKKTIDEEVSHRLGTGQWMQIHSCNIISGCMDVFTLNEKNEWEREKILVDRVPYKGKVYSIDMDEYHTYISNGIVTHNCPLAAIGKEPLARQCLLEVQLLKQFVITYFEEYDIDPNNFTEVAYINELAEIEILLMRLNMNLSKPENAELVIDQVVGIANDRETPLLVKQISPFMELKDKLQNRRSKIIKLMVGDRQEQYKKEAALKVKIDKDPSSKQAEMRSRLELLQRGLENAQIAAVQNNPSLQKTTLSPEDIINGEDFTETDTTDSSLQVETEEGEESEG